MPYSSYRISIALTLILLGTGTYLVFRGNPVSVGQPQEVALPSEPEPGGTLVLGFTSDLSNLNEIAASSSQATSEILQRLFVRLLDEQPDFQDHPPTFKPRLAESYEWSDDHKKVTFHLRKDAVWSDGVPITAADVRWTWQAQTDPLVAWDNAAMKESITEVEVIDPHTVRFHFTHAYPGQMVHANEGVILPKHAWSELPFSDWVKNAQWFQDNLVVSGPFQLESWKPQEQIVLSRNERYFEAGLPLVDRVVIKVVPDLAAQLTLFQGGTLDYLRQVPASLADQVAQSPQTRLVTYWPAQFTTLMWNLRRDLFNTAQVRRALTLAIDRKTIVDTIWHGYARTANSPIISSVWGHNRDLEHYPYSPEQARNLLAAEGWQDTDGNGILDRGGVDFSFEILVNSGNQERIDTAVMIQNQLQKVGIAVQPRVLEWSTIDARMSSGEFGALIMGLSVETSLDVSSYFHSKKMTSGLNSGGYSNPDADQLMTDIRNQIDQQTAQPLLNRLQEILHEDQPQTFLWEPQRLVGLSNRVQDASPNVMGTLDNLRHWWIFPKN